MRSSPMRRGGFKRPSFYGSPPGTEARAQERMRRMGLLLENFDGRPSTYAGTTAAPIPKEPADRNQAVRDLAMGEECQVRYRPVCRGPGVTEYTVWAHPNTQAENKGGAYKGNDSGGVFACDRCHWAVDFDRKILPAIELEEVWRGARERTLIRLKAIATSSTERAWRIRAAQWALERVKERAT